LASRSANRQAYALLDLYCVCYEQTHGKKPVINKYRDRWGFQDMIDSIGYDDSVETIKYFFETSSPGHKIPVLLSSFDKMLTELRARQRDRAARESLRKRTQEIVEEWEDNS
jgi:hypothetical protein